MANIPASHPSDDELQVAIECFLRDGPTLEEKDAYQDALLAKLTQELPQVPQGYAAQEFVVQGLSGQETPAPKDFQEAVSKAGAASEGINRTFKEISSSFYEMAFVTYREQYPSLSDFFEDWNAYNLRWFAGLQQSRVEALMGMDTLSRFESVYLTMIENIQTEQDRQKAAKALQQFVALAKQLRCASRRTR